uniref:C3H1-type domain-containing protein n=1 Tax=Attheya septentrionalis TaxID=420275 RepID=A0A7S2UK96_9STRA|mmetsp:Transcript_26545/g.48156  ORF Transcript_26545/g.48156 Transcript_26545/m.48156 type:complete len:570 (+) Transcript_26545:2-1711(+)
MESDIAKDVLQQIFFSVRTGSVNNFGNTLKQPIVDGEHSNVSVEQEPSYISGERDDNIFDHTSGAAFGTLVVPEDHNDSIDVIGAMLTSTRLDESETPQASLRDLYGSEYLDSPVGNMSEGDAMPSFLLDEDEEPLTGENDNIDNRGLVSGFSLFEEETSPYLERKQISSIPSVPTVTPLKANSLIPVDLLGVLDDPTTPRRVSLEVSLTHEAQSNESSTKYEKQHSFNSKRSSKKKKSKAAGQDLAASLFCSSRPRSSSMSIPEIRSPKLRSMSCSVVGSRKMVSSYTGISPLLRQQIESASQLLLSMNSDLSDEAAMEAAFLSNGDVNIAQYAIDEAVSAPPVCRHMLHSACYRSDCQFSHDVEGHTCLFWLRGRCGKGELCRFLHGLSENLLEGMNKDFLQGHRKNVDRHASFSLDSSANTAVPLSSSQPIPIKTGNLLEHNMKSTGSGSFREKGSISFLSSSYDPAPGLTSSFVGSPFPFSLSMPKQHNLHHASSLASRTSEQSGFETDGSSFGSEGHKKQSALNINNDARYTMSQETSSALAGTGGIGKAVADSPNLLNNHSHI